MSNFGTTRFFFRSKDGQQIQFGHIEVYTVGRKWEVLSDGDPHPTQNPGIGNPSIENPVFDGPRACIVTLKIDPQLVNSTVYASDGASLLFSINGSNMHINIHKYSKMDVAGIYGPQPDAISWSYDGIRPVGSPTDFFCQRNR